MNKAQLASTLVDQNRLHCAMCGRTFQQKWQRQIHERAYLSTGQFCPKAVK